MNLLDTFLRSQFGRPSGLIGSLVVAPLLNAGNAGLVQAAMEALAPNPADAVLDIGFGGGASLVAMAEKVPRGHVTGIDYSPDMVAGAERLILKKRLSARVGVQFGDVAELPFRAGTFHRVLTVNSLYYWPDLQGALREIRRVLKRGGRVAVGFHSPWSVRLFTRGWEGFWLYEPRELADRMQEAGFEVLQTVHRDRWLLFDSVVVLGQRR